MDELDFQRKAYAEPNCQDKAFLQHKKQLPDKQSLLDDLNSLDSQLKSALNIMPPPGLVERIELKQTLLHHQSVRKQCVYVAVIAGVFVCCGLLLFFFTHI